MVALRVHGAMLKQNWRFISRLERLGDTVLILCSFVLAYYGRDSMLFWNRYYRLDLPFEGPVLAPIQDYAFVFLVAWVGYMITLNLLGAYSSMRMSSSFRLIRIAFASSFFVFLLLSSTLFIMKLDLSRSFVILFCTLVALSLAAERFLVLRLLRVWRSRGRNFRNVMVCGVGEQATRLAVEIAKRPELGIRIRIFADLQETTNPARQANFRVGLRRHGIEKVGRIVHGGDAVQRALQEYAIDEVIFTDVVDVMPVVEELVLVCSEQGVRTTLAADLFSLGMVKSGLSYFGGMPLIHFQTPPGDRWELAVKRLIDISVSCFLILLLAPIGLLVGALIKFDSPGPILFSQRRVGLNGRLFWLFKFRSMHLDAEAQRADLEKFNEMQGPVFKMKNDPRTTRVGRILRRFSLDELPQLWNVVIGDMSLVGPRPPVPGEVGLYERRERRRLSMRPGLTCTWQVSGRNDNTDFSSWVKLDLEYIDNWSLTHDVVLLFRTIPAVLLGTGAR